MEKFEVTKETILKYNMKDEFPECFEVELKVGEWYKGSGHLFCYQEGTKVYGFNSTGWEFLSNKSWSWEDRNVTPATNEEVKEALISEAVNRGFTGEVTCLPLDGKEQVTRKGMFNNYGFLEKENQLLYCNFLIFDNGKWARITPTLTKKEAEEKFNIKILLAILLFTTIATAQQTVKSVNTSTHRVVGYVVQTIAKTDTTYQRVEKFTDLPLNVKVNKKDPIKNYPVSLLKKGEVYLNHKRANVK